MSGHGAHLVDRVARLGIGLVSIALVAQGIGPVAVAQDEQPADMSGGAPPSIAASIVNFAFEPADLAVKVGDTVVWTNNGSAPHTTTSDAGVWDSGTLSPGGTSTFTFTAAGTFQYRCNIHPAMRGTITVS
jgi:plastocyanin